MARARAGFESFTFYIPADIAQALRHKAVDARRSPGELVGEMVQEALAPRGARRATVGELHQVEPPEGAKLCEFCKKNPVEPRASGGSPRVFCSPRCRDGAKRKRRATG
jgi:hypothetical protein